MLEIRIDVARTTSIASFSLFFFLLPPADLSRWRLRVHEREGEEAARSTALANVDPYTPDDGFDRLMAFCRH